MKAEYKGISDDMIRLVERKQLKDRKLWELVTKQFEKTPDDADHGWRGEYWGKLMRGACMTWQYTKDKELYGVLREAVVKLLATQDEYGRIATYSRKEEFHGWDIWCRKYVLLGLIHFYAEKRLCGRRFWMRRESTWIISLPISGTAGGKCGLRWRPMHGKVLIPVPFWSRSSGFI